MRTIVVPVNFTPNSSNAARYAADMALVAEADLYLLYVLQLPVSVAEFPLNDYVFNEMQESGAEALKQLQEELLKRTEGKINVSTHMEIGAVEAKIEEYCKEKHPFIVVMGASGHTLETALTGSNLTAALRRLPYPLIIVPESVTFKKIGKAVLACDLEDISGGMPVKPTFLKELRDIFQSKFEVVNINTGKQAKTTAAVMDNEAWKSCLEESFPEVHIVDTGNVELGIGQYLFEHGADMLIVFPKKHNFFEFHKSHAKRLALNGSIPIMSIHA
ncbi:MAG TPA: universal stress protein [Puia sp.]|nr:universal stress protein [Puia sp.]